MTRRNRYFARLVAVSAAATVALATVTMPATAGPKDDLEQERQQNASEREELEASLEGTGDDLTDLYLELDETKRRLPEAEAELEVRNEELDAAERELESVQGRLDVAETQRDDLSAEMEQGDAEMDGTTAAMGEVARDAYRGGNGISTIGVIVNATSAEDFASSYSAMNSAMRTQDDLLADLQNDQAVNRNRQSRLSAVEERINDLETEADEAVEAADAARDSAADLVDEIDQLKQDQEDQAEKLEDAKEDGEEQLAKLESDDDDLAQEIDDIVEEERAKQREREKSQPNQPSQPDAPNNDSGGGGGGGSGSIIPPVNRSDLHVTSPWGMREYPITGGQFMHNGVDLSSPHGEAQIAAAAGTVTAVRNAAGNGTHGNQVMINHGSINGHVYQTVYNHLSGFAVSQGQKVSQGETIAYTGATGMVTGAHIHFEVWKDGKTIDPMTLPGF